MRHRHANRSSEGADVAASLGNVDAAGLGDDGLFGASLAALACALACMAWVAHRNGWLAGGGCTSGGMAAADGTISATSGAEQGAKGGIELDVASSTKDELTVAGPPSSRRNQTTALLSETLGGCSSSSNTRAAGRARVRQSDLPRHGQFDLD